MSLQDVIALPSLTPAACQKCIKRQDRMLVCQWEPCAHATSCNAWPYLGSPSGLGTRRGVVGNLLSGVTAGDWVSLRGGDMLLSSGVAGSLLSVQGCQSDGDCVERRIERQGKRVALLDK